MLSPITFPNQYLVFSKDLPLTLISLEEWIFIKLYGRDMIQYLHNQLTCDIKNLNKNKYSFSAHCSPQGKTFSSMYVFHLRNQKMAFIERLNIYKKQIAEMKKYAVFSDISIVPDYNTILVGIAGINARKYLNTFFSVLPNETNTVVHDKDVTLLYFSVPIERFLLIINKKSTLDDLLKKSQFSIQLNNSQQWALLDMEAGYPIIEPTTSGIFLPQSINIDTLQGISFNKGCYIGQESIARMTYRGRNKQALYCFSGFIDYKNYCALPVAGDRVELKLNHQCWQNIGVVLQSCRVKTTNTILVVVQAVLNKLILENSEIKIINTQTNKNINLFVVGNK